MEEKMSQFVFQYVINTRFACMKNIPDGVDTTFGEVTQCGVTQFINQSIFKIKEAKQVCDFGMGNGKLILQLFEECPWITKVIGIEIHPDRFSNSIQNLINLSKHLSKTRTDIEYMSITKYATTKIILTIKFENKFERQLIMEKCSVTDCVSIINQFDVMFFNIIYNSHLNKLLSKLLSRTKSKSTIISYQNIDKLIEPKNYEISRKHKINTSWNDAKIYTPFVYHKL